MRKRIHPQAPPAPHPRGGAAVLPEAEPLFVPLSAAVFTQMAWDCLAADTPAGRRGEAVTLARAYLAEAVALPLKTMGTDDLALAILQLRCSLAQLLTVVDHVWGVRPAEAGGQRDPEDLVADLLDLIAATAPLNAGVAIDVAQPLPPHLIDALAGAIGSPGLRWHGTCAEAVGSCGSSAIRVTTTCLAGA